MHLSERKVEELSSKILEALLDADVISFDMPEEKMAVELERFLLSEFRIEDEIHEQALAKIATYSRKIEEGSTEWQVLLQKTKEELARKRGYVL